MIEAVTGEHYYPELEDAPQGLVGTLTLRLEDSDGNVVEPDSTAGITEPIDGEYRATRTAPEITPDTPDAETYFRLVWTNGAVEIDEALHVLAVDLAFAGYPTSADLVAASSSAELAALSDDQTDALRSEAIVAVEGYCHQSFLPEGTLNDPVTKHVVGRGGDTLSLPKRLVSLGSASISDTALEDLTIADDAAAIVWAGGSNSTWLERALSDSRTTEFTNGGQVAVSGVWGWSEVPEAVVNAIRFHMEDRAASEAHKLAPTVRAARALGLDSVNQGNLSLSLRNAEPILTARAKRQLRGYVWQTAGVAV